MTHTNQSNFDITIASFHLNSSGLRPLGIPTFAQWLACGHFIRNAEQSVQFWIGDWLLYGERTYGKTDYEQAVQETGLAYQTLRIYKYVASSLPLSLRRNKLSFHHHKEVANLSRETQAQLLDQAEAQNWPVIKLKQEKYRLQLETARSSSSASALGLFCGDPQVILTQLPDASIDLVLTAPDYALISPADLDSVFALLERKLKMNSHLYLFCTWETYPPLLPLLQTHFTVKNVLVWEKTQPLVSSLTHYRQGYEFVLFAQKGRRHLNGRRDASLLTVPHEAEIDPTHKPFALLEYLIQKSTQPGEIVCDLFMGAGAICLAAQNTGRRFLGIETDTAKYKQACQRLVEKRSNLHGF